MNYSTPTTDNFQRTRLETRGRGVTVTSWFDANTQVWHANVPAWNHLMGNLDQNAITGATREKAIQAALNRLAPLLPNEAPAPRSFGR